MENQKRAGLWPVMLTPFTAGGEIDNDGLDALIDFYERGGADGLFAVCQSSESFFLTEKERLHLAKRVSARSRLPVIACGNVGGGTLREQAREILSMRDAGANAVILVTNRLMDAAQDGESLDRTAMRLLALLPDDLSLGLYECPYPYKYLIKTEELSGVARTGRFAFLKDTCCDIARIRERLTAIDGTALKLYNANTTTLLDSLRAGAAGFSGVMANFHPDLYAWVLKNYAREPEKAEDLSAFLAVSSLIERQLYPVNAKYFLREIEGLQITDVCRSVKADQMTDTFRREARDFARLTDIVRERLKEAGV